MLSYGRVLTLDFQVVATMPGISSLNPVTPPLACALVDGDPSIRNVLRLSIGNLATDVLECSDTRELRNLLDGQPPNIIFLDACVGPSDAVEALRLLRDDAFKGSVQLMSGRERGLLDDINDIGRRYGLNMLEPLQKPFRAEAIRTILREQIDQARRKPAGTRPSIRLAHAGTGKPTTLADALDNSQMEIWYQPKVRLIDGTIYGAEGLARIRHSDQTVSGPDSFMPDDDDEALDRLTEFALIAALKDSGDFLRLGFPIRLAVNIPAPSLRRLDIAAIVRANMPTDSDWPGVILELTENHAMDDRPATHEIATQLKILGVGLSLDDFGTAYASLGNLTEELFEEVKLDRSYVAGCSENSRIAALAETVVDLARRIDIAAVAEGVENRSDRNALIRMGCKFGQGHLFSAAVPKAGLLSLLRRGRLG